jgi:hypothetical protein
MLKPKRISTHKWSFIQRSRIHRVEEEFMSQEGFILVLEELNSRYASIKSRTTKPT